MMREHLHAVVGRYRGRAFAWNVVNEPMKEDCYWRKHVGDDWVERALQFAHEADPETTLLINEYKVERGLLDGRKGTAFYERVKRMKERGVPIHAVGFQGYFDLGTNIEDVKRAMRLYADIGIKVHVTELAVRVYSDRPTPEMLKRQAVFYASFLGACLNEPNCEVLTVFGVTDKMHWLVVKGEKESPVLFDRQYRPKPAYFALLETLEATGARK
jgi:endo-1,4-beta-xylanase